MNFFSQNYSGDVNIDSEPNPILHPFRPGIVIHIAPESLFTSLRNDYSHAPESAHIDVVLLRQVLGRQSRSKSVIHIAAAYGATDL